MEHPTINDLPNELLEVIFDHLDVDDLKAASLVCRRWSDLTFSGRRMDRVKLVLGFRWYKDLLQSNRKYRHLLLAESEKCSAHVKELFQAFNVCSMRINDWYLSHSSLRLILLEVPNLQHLSIAAESDEMNEMMESLPVMSKLEHLEFDYSNRRSALPWHTIAPALQGLKMACECEAHLEQWGLFSGQLKQVNATFHGENLLNRFWKMTFPLLEELSIKSKFGFGRYEHDLFERHEFFRRTASLRRLRLNGIALYKTLLQDITSHNKKLTSLELIGVHRAYQRSGEPGPLESLSQLPELKYLRLKNFDASIFLGCEPLTSLQSLSINAIRFGDKDMLGFVEDLFKIAPQLRCLDLGSFQTSERAAHFICNNFLKLTRLQLTYSEKLSREGFSGIDRLQHLWCLELDLFYAKTLFISTIPQNKVRYLTLHLPGEYDNERWNDDVLRLPEIFPQLDRLNLVISPSFPYESIVNEFRKLLPTCAIKIYHNLIDSGEIIRSFWKWTRDEMMPVWEKGWTFYHLEELF